MTPELYDYIRAHIDAEPEALSRLDRESNLRLVNGRMCSGHLQGRLLKMFVRMVRPQRILELGAFSGYSALCMAEGMPAGASILSVEANDELRPFILRAWTGAERRADMELQIAHALTFMRTLPTETFDMIFIDADKRQYTAYYEEALRLLRPGGFIVADNTLWDGHVADTHRRQADPQTRGVHEFNERVAADARVEKVILPVRDGLTIIYKKGVPTDAALGCGANNHKPIAPTNV